MRHYSQKEIDELRAEARSRGYRFVILLWDRAVASTHKWSVFEPRAVGDKPHEHLERIGNA